MTEQIWHLKQCDLFQQLSDEEIKRLELSSKSRNFGARTPILLPEEKRDSLFFVADGLVSISSLGVDGKKSTLAFVEKGELFGELVLFDDGNPEEFVEAVEKTTLVMIPIEEIRRVIAEHSDFAFFFNTSPVTLTFKRSNRFP